MAQSTPIIILHVATFYHSMYTLFIIYYTKNIPPFYDLSLLNYIALLYTEILFSLLLLLKGIKLQIMKGG